MERYIDRERFIKDKREWYCKDCDRRKSTNGKIIYETGGAPCKSCGVNDMLDELEDYPAADVEEVRRGKWILEREPDGKPYCYHCSNCDDDFHHIGITVASKRCPECGAHMDQEHIYERDGSVCGAKIDGGKE